MDARYDTTPTDHCAQPAFPWRGLLFGALLLTPVVAVATVITAFLPRHTLSLAGMILIALSLTAIVLSKKLRQAVQCGDWVCKQGIGAKQLFTIAAFVFYAQFLVGWAERTLAAPVRTTMGIFLLVAIAVEVVITRFVKARRSP